MTRILIALLVAIPMAVTAQIYKSTDEHGNTVYSDTPPPGAINVESVRLGTTNTAPPPPNVPKAPPPVVEEKIEVSATITSPEPDTTISVGYAGNFSVNAEISPALEAGATVLLMMDDLPMGAPQTTPSWQLVGTLRGAHILTVIVTSADGETLAESPPVTVYIRRASSNH